MKALKIKIEGIVQGVGFRPFVWRIAHKNGISGFVRNESWGVNIFVQGQNDDLSNFIACIRNDLPPAARIDSLEIFEVPPDNRIFEFTIEPSERSEIAGLIPPDLSVCKKCISEMFDSNNRRYYYPFINCTNCGPRFSIIEELPYDRPNTTMSEFNMCSECKTEYEFPANRRYHAQPIACPSCGPEYFLDFRNNDNDELKGKISGVKAIEIAAKLLSEGKIVATQGIGGFHLMCSAMNIETIERLRCWKNRPRKPFAVMARDIATVKKIAEMSDFDESVINNPSAPILLLQKKENTLLGNKIAPEISNIGVMLPYAPIHHLLFHFGAPEIIVATSGNLRNEPIAKSPEEAMRDLSIADAFLWHNRRIHNRVDDSVAFSINKNLILIRQSRGYTPARYVLPVRGIPVIAAGADMKSSIAISDGKNVYTSQYLGEMSDPKTQDFWRETVEKFLRWLNIKPKAVITDLHPDYLSTRLGMELAERFQISIVSIQHHHSHAWAEIAEKQIKTPVIAVVFDGTGLGTDGTIWGGEFFIAKPDGSIERTASLRKIPQPGGDRSALKISRMAFAYLYRIFSRDVAKLNLPVMKYVSPFEMKIIQKIITKNQAPLTSSMGRLFDAAAAIIGVTFYNSYEAEAPMLMESIVDNIDLTERLNYEIIEKDDFLELNFDLSLKELALGMLKGEKVSILSNLFHSTVAFATAEIIMRLAKKYDIEDVILSGGVFQNSVLLQMISEILKEKIRVHLLGYNPPNDQGIALGQAYWGSLFSNAI